MKRDRLKLWSLTWEVRIESLPCDSCVVGQNVSTFGNEVEKQ
jgi:hypothetical protein